jgi:phenylpyruvate tautomerase PptA (4-oxalocrotonate tautomerase family)
MPMWKVYYPEGAYTAEDKQEFAEAITGLYAQFNLPAFYVTAIFRELPATRSTSAGSRHPDTSGSGSTTSRAVSPTTTTGGGWTRSTR